MSNNGFIQNFTELLLSWMRLLTSWVWEFFQADRAGGFMAWFADHWVKIALALIIIGVFVDWLIWMIRWRPYWLWLRKRQIIYEEVPAKRGSGRTRPLSRKKPTIAPARSSGYFDPFASDQQDPYAPAKPAADNDDWASWDAADDPYAPVTHTEKHKS